MDEVIKTIYNVESECAAKIEAERDRCDAMIKKRITECGTLKEVEKKRIIGENERRYGEEVGIAEREIQRELSDLKAMLSGLKDNTELCNEVKNRIVSVIIKSR